MKLPGAIGTAALLLIFSGVSTVYLQAQDDKPPQQEPQAKPPDHPEDAKPPKQQEPKPEPDAKPPKPKPEPRPQPDAKPPKPQPEPKPQPDTKPPKQEKEAQAPKQGQQTKVNRGGRIPDGRYRAKFGAEHRFHVGHLTVVNGASRFQYGGYWFELVDPWPAGWAYTDDVYVVFLDGTYYLCDPNYPGVQVAIMVVE